MKYLEIVLRHAQRAFYNSVFMVGMAYQDLLKEVWLERTTRVCPECDCRYPLGEQCGCDLPDAKMSYEPVGVHDVEHEDLEVSDAWTSDYTAEDKHLDDTPGDGFHDTDYPMDDE